MLNIVLSVLEEVVHIDQQDSHGDQVEDAKEHERPIEKQGLGFVDSLKNSAVVADLNHEAKEELVSP